jgi:hypothetical protein
MISDFGSFVAAVYFSGLIYILIPASGAIVGAVAGRLTPSVSVALGPIVGLASGAAGLVLSILAFWILRGFGSGDLDLSGYLSLLLAFGLPLGGVFAPIAVLPLARRWRS